MSEHSIYWHEGQAARKISDHVNPYDAGSVEHADWAAGHEHQGDPLSLSDVSIITGVGEKPGYSPFGYVVDEQGTAYALCHRYYHGVICALLYPDLARAHAAGIPIHPLDEINVFEFQHFEHDNASSMNVVRIATSMLSGTTYFSKGRAPATENQIKTVAAICADMGFTGKDEIETNMGSQTVAQILEGLREGEDFEEEE
jgi:hypothetical protein